MFHNEVIIRLNEFKRDRQGNWIHPIHGFVVSYEKMINLAKEVGINYHGININEDYLTLSLMNGNITFMHFDRFINVEYVVKEEEYNDRIGIKVQE